MYGVSLCLYSDKGMRVRHFALLESAQRLMYSSRYGKVALACGYTHWEIRRD